MLTNLQIKNYALIQHLEMHPDKELNIITGETGAGKSIMLGAVGLLSVIGLIRKCSTSLTKNALLRKFLIYRNMI